MLSIKRDLLHFHATMHINYTSYEGVRKQDTLKPFLKISSESCTSGNSDHCMVMLASSEDDKVAGGHPFWYAQVLSIFHCFAYRTPAWDFQRINVLWVRWIGRETGYASGLEAMKLDKVGFIEGGDGDVPFGFVDPIDVVRSAHLIPSFREGRVSNLFQIKSLVQDKLGDWSFFYVGR